MSKAYLVLEDGETFEGESFGATGETVGEVVFNTSMTGYQEVLTDPSYSGQIVAMTYPHVGNYGVNDEDHESGRVHVKGFVVRDVPRRWSSWRGSASIEDYLIEHSIPGICEVDTRRLTRHIRSKGAMRGVISSIDQAGDQAGGISPERLAERAADSMSMLGADLVSEVTAQEPYVWQATGQKRFSVAAIDYGIKHNILRMMAALGCETAVYPSSTSAEVILETGPDGVFLSNGPGDPAAVKDAVDQVGHLAGKVPIFGICLGHQLLCRAAGLDTFKLLFGHRGSNHPVMRLSDGAVEITTQNHGFAVDPAPFGFDPPKSPGQALPLDQQAETHFGRARLTHLNLNDYTIEGVAFDDLPAYAVQYHPEAGPGPSDSRYLFDGFMDLMQSAKTNGRRRL